MNDRELLERLFAKGLLVLRSEIIVNHDEGTRVSWIEHGETRDMDILNETYDEFKYLSRDPKKGGVDG